jgi:hypothetical protein
VVNLIIVVRELPANPFSRRGDYGKRGDHLPSRFRWMQPEAAEALVRLEDDHPGVFRYSDVLRSAEGSKAVRQKYKKRKGRYWGKLPGSSGHNVGLCTDDKVSDNLRRLKAFWRCRKVTKRDYDMLKREYGFWCHRDGPRGDHAREHEDWHFNYFGDDPERWLRHCKTKTSGGLEAKFKVLYGPFKLTKVEIQKKLAQLGYYKGRIDGILGKKSREATWRFQLAWTLKPDGIAGVRTQRVLRFVTAEFVDEADDPVVIK